MTNFFGSDAVKLVRGASMNPVASVAEALEGRKYVLVYFSAHWCPPCRAFTPVLREFYNKFSAEKNFEVVFVSLDKSANAMSAYMETAHGDWLAMDYNSAKSVGEKWAQTYNVGTIPAILVFENTSSPDNKKEGGRRLITSVGRDMMIQDEEAEMFPWVDGEAHMAAYNRGLLRNIIICVIISLCIGWALFQYTF